MDFWSTLVVFMITPNLNAFSAGTAFKLIQTCWIQASRRVTRRLAWDPTFLPLSLSFPIKQMQNLQVVKSRRQYNLFLENYPALKGLTLIWFTSSVVAEALNETMKIIWSEPSDELDNIFKTILYNISFIGELVSIKKGIFWKVYNMFSRDKTPPKRLNDAIPSHLVLACCLISNICEECLRPYFRLTCVIDTNI